MENFDKKQVDEYVRLNSEYQQTQKSLTNLEKLKSTINEDRFNVQKQEYDETIERILPELNTLKEKLEEDLNVLSQEFDVSKTEYDKINQAIEEEKKLYKGKAISKDQYNESLKQLKNELKIVKPRYNELKSQIELVEGALSNKRTVKPSKSYNFPSKETPSFIPEGTRAPKGKSSFGKDLGKGLLVIFAIIIAVPLIGMFLLSLKGIALVIVPVVALILVIAFFGKIVNFIQEIWR